jgi:amino acid permease
MYSIPHELAFGEVFMPPILVVGFLALFLTIVTARLLNRYRLSRYLANPSLVFVAMVVIYTIIIGTFLIRI